MIQSITKTLDDVAKAIQVGVSIDMLRWSLISDGWPVKRADLMIRWGQMYNRNIKKLRKT